jgi:hypothetical protein
MEDEGTLADHLSGVAATDGQWHHIAVTWESSSGTVILYLDSREVWRVKRGKGKKIPSGGTLVIGREQVSCYKHSNWSNWTCAGSLMQQSKDAYIV